MSENVCRTCTKISPSLFDIYLEFKDDQIGEKNMSDLLISLGCLQEADTDSKLPHSICDDCADKAFKAQDFKQMCLKSKDMLQTMYENRECHYRGDNNTEKHTDAKKPNKIITQNNGIGNECLSSIDSVFKELETDDESCISKYSYESSKESKASIGVKQSQYLCYRCGKTLTTRQQFLSHRACKSFKCEFCDQQYKKSQSLREHLRVAHSDNRCIYCCEICKTRFTSKSSFYVHKKHHLGLKRYSCSTCFKSFTRSPLKAHINKIHNGQVCVKMRDV